MGARDRQPATRERVLVAMSGGVDSAVAAALLHEEGFEVIGVTLRLGADPSSSCCDLGSLDSARAAAARLGIAHQVWEAADRFEASVLRPAWDEYARGRTPNPCIWCNEALKFRLLLEEADRQGARWIATGHYARVHHPDPPAGAARSPHLRRGRDRGKDQSYFLYRLTRAQLARCRFPLGELTKARVRQHAQRLGLPCARRAESQDACLVAAEGGFAEALRQRLGAPARPGEIRDPGGRILGHHQGVHNFTLGQRRGTGVATGGRAYVSAIDAEQAAVTLSSTPRDLLSVGLTVRQPHWLPEASPRPERERAAQLQNQNQNQNQIQIQIQIRYRSPPVSATATVAPDGTLRVRFSEPQRAVTPGQAAVLYEGDRLLGGGPIDERVPVPDHATTR
jgi:tRNA-specific 2-thiouridylase